MARVNLETNPSVETGVAGYTVGYTAPGVALYSSPNPNRSSNAAGQPAGSWWGFVNFTGGGSGTYDDLIVRVANVPVTAGVSYTFTAALRTNPSGARKRIGVDWLDAAGNLISAANAPYVTQDVAAFERQTLTATAPAGATQARRTLWYISTQATLSGGYWDALLFERTDTFEPTAPYFDGSTAGGGAWTGTAHASTSTYPSSAVAIALDTVVEVEQVDPVVASTEMESVVEHESALPVTAVGTVELAVIDEVETPPVVDVVVVIPIGVITETETVPTISYTPILAVIVEYETVPPVREPRRTTAAGPARALGMRVIAQRVTDGVFLDWELPVADLSITATLSGPQAITGNLRPHLPRVAELGLAPWATWLHVEDGDGLIRASAILVTPFGVTDDQRSLEAAGVSTYPHQAIYEGIYSGFNLDPLDVVRLIWAHVQSFPGANLGVRLSQNTSSVRIGGFQSEATTIRVDDTSSSSTEAKPYELNWWDQSNCGEEIDKLAQNVPFDYVERQAWNSTHTAVDHFVDLGWPRVGARRGDLRFVTGENIIGAVPVVSSEDSFVTDVRVTGAGDGQSKILGRASRRADQLRRVIQIDEQTVKSTARANAIAAAELARRAIPRGVDTLLVDALHINAPFGSYQVGDDIFVQVEVDWVGEIAMWHRIVEYTYTPDEEAVALKLQPGDSFRYGASA